MASLCDNCQKMLKLKDPDYNDLKQAFLYLVEYFYTELGWEHFRAEFLAQDYQSEKIHIQNAALITRAIEELKMKWPDVFKITNPAGAA